MIQIVSIQKADNEEPPHYELAYVDLEKKKNEKGYFQTTKYGTEAELRKLLKSSEVPDIEIDRYFEEANRLS